MNDKPSIRVLGFKAEYKPSKVSGEPRVIHWVEYAPVSAIMTNRVWARIDHIRPPERDLTDDDDGKKMMELRYRWSMIEPAYNAWISGQEIPTHGTPLAAWPGLQPAQVAELQRLGIKTVEEVAAMTDATIGKIPLPGAREFPKQARLFLENTDRAQAAEEMKARDDRIAALEEQLAAALELLEQQTKPKRAKTGDEGKAA